MFVVLLDYWLTGDAKPFTGDAKPFTGDVENESGAGTWSGSGTCSGTWTESGSGTCSATSENDALLSDGPSCRPSYRNDGPYDDHLRGALRQKQDQAYPFVYFNARFLLWVRR